MFFNTFQILEKHLIGLLHRRKWHSSNCKSLGLFVMRLYFWDICKLQIGRCCTNFSQTTWKTVRRRLDCGTSGVTVMHGHKRSSWSRDSWTHRQHGLGKGRGLEVLEVFQGFSSFPYKDLQLVQAKFLLAMKKLYWHGFSAGSSLESFWDVVEESEVKVMSTAIWFFARQFAQDDSLSDGPKRLRVRDFENGMTVDGWNTKETNESKPSWNETIGWQSTSAVVYPWRHTGKVRNHCDLPWTPWIVHLRS